MTHEPGQRKTAPLNVVPTLGGEQDHPPPARIIARETR